MGEVGEHAGVGVGGEHDAGVAEHRLHNFEVIVGGQGQAGRAVAQVMQPDRRQGGVADQAVERRTEPIGLDRVAAQSARRSDTPLLRLRDVIANPDNSAALGHGSVTSAGHRRRCKGAGKPVAAGLIGFSALDGLGW